MKKLFTAALFLAAALVFTSCEKDKDNSPSYDLSKGLIIVNEGSDFGSISHYNPATDAVTNNIFKTINNREVGKYLQGVCAYGDYVYLVVGGSAKVEVINKYTSKEVATISGLENPRYMVNNGSTGYVSLWGTDEVAVLDLTNNTIKQRIKVGPDPEGLLIQNNLLYVANSNGSNTDKPNNTVSVIDLKTNSVIKEFAVKDSPKAFTVDKNGAIWAICAGFTNYKEINTNSFLCKINTSDYTFSSIDLGSKHYDRIAINPEKDMIYYCGSYDAPNIFRVEIVGNTAPTKPLIEGDFYGVLVHPTNGEIYGMKVNWATKDPHKLVRYTKEGKEIKSYDLVFCPNGGTFTL